MKKVLYSLLAFAALLTAASCQKEFINSPDPADGGKPVKMTYSVDLGTATKAIAETAMDDGKTVDKLYVAAFGSDGSLISTSLVGENVASISNKTATVTLTLSKGQAYDIVFFAMKDGAYDVSFADNNTATFAFKSTVKANDPTLDAFYAKKHVDSAAPSSEPEVVTLKRPFAQINVLSSDKPAGQNGFKSTMTVKQVPTSFDLLNEKAGTTLADVTFASNDIAATAFGKYADGGYYWIGMNFILVPEAGTVNLSFEEQGMKSGALKLTNLTVKKNGRTNLVGAIYNLEANVIYTVNVDPAFGDEGEAHVGDLDTDITVTSGDTYTDNNPLVIDATNGLNAVNVGLNINDDTFNFVEEHATDDAANNGKIVADSSDENVVTASVDLSNNRIVLTPVGNGDAVVTVTSPRYTKTDYAPGTIKIPVRVTGATVEKKDVTITVTSTGLELELYNNPTGTVSATAEDSDGNPVDVIFTSNDESIVTVDQTLGTVTAQSAGTTTIVVSTAETETLNAATPVEIPVTVVDPYPVGPPVNAKTLPYEETFLSSIGDFTTDDVVVEGSEAKVWTQSSQYGMVATSYVKDTGASSKTNHAADSWLTSPLIAIPSDATAPTLTFDHAVNYFTDVATAQTEATAWIKEEGGSWTQLVIAYPTSLSYTFLSSGEIDLSAYKGKNVQIGFHYTSTATKSGTWEIKNFKVEDATSPIETTISFAKESLSLTVGSSATNAVTTNSTGAKTFTSSNTSVAEVDDTGKVTAKAEGTATITVSIAQDGRYTAASDSYDVTVTAASGDTAPVGTVLWEETWTGASDAQAVDKYAFGGTTVFGGATVTYSSVGGTKVCVDNQMDGNNSQENLMLGKKANDVSGTWSISGIPTGKASKAILKVYTNNGNTFKSDLVTLTSSDSSVKIGAKTQGTETAKPYSFTFEIEFGTATSIDLLFTNGYSQNVRIDDITLTVTE